MKELKVQLAILEKDDLGMRLNDWLLVFSLNTDNQSYINPKRLYLTTWE